MSEFDVFARFYDLDYGEVQEDIDLYRNFVRRTGGPVLELACGTGRVLIPIAQDGYDVTGIDVSRAMLAVADEKARRARVADRVELVEADMRSFSVDQRYALAIVAVNSFLHLITTEDRIDALNRIARHLQKDGLLIVDLFNPDPYIFPTFDGRMVHDSTKQVRESGKTVVKFSSTRVDLAKQVLRVTFFYDEVSPEGEVRRTIAPFSLSYLFHNEVGLLLDRAGLHQEAIYGSYDLEPYDSESPRMIVVARKE